MELFHDVDMRPEAEINTQQRIEELRVELLDRGDHPPAGDQVLGACSVAMAGLFAYPEVQARVADIIKNRRQFKPHEHLPTWALAHMLTTSAHNLAFKTLSAEGKKVYPKVWSKADTWTSFLEKTLRVGTNYSVSDAFDEFSFYPTMYGLQTIKPNREAPIKVLAHYQQLRHKRAVNRIDFGPSRGDGLVVYRDNIPFEDIAVVNTTTDEASTMALRALLSLPIDSSGQLRAVEIDRIRPSDKLRFDWWKSCYLRPKDLRNSSKRRLIEQLSTESEKLEIIEGDFCAPPEEFSKLAIPSVHDMCSASSSLYAVSRPFLYTAIVNGIETLRPGGLVAINEYVDINPDNPYDLHIHDRIQEDFGYRTIALDPAEPDEGFQEIARWKDGNCREMMIGDSNLARKVWAKLGILSTRQLAKPHLLGPHSN